MFTLDSDSSNQIPMPISAARCLLAISFLSIAGCASPPRQSVYHIVTTDSRYLCCRTIRFTTAEFPRTEPSSLAGEGVVTSLERDTVAASCGRDAGLPLAIANNGGEDVYIPISNELEGERLKIYPWRYMSRDGRVVRLARQLQYGDLVEGTDAKLRFFRLPAGRQVRFEGTIPAAWTCARPVSPEPEYLNAELDPKVYADYTRMLRGSVGKADSAAIGTWGLQYDVVYTSLSFLSALPVTERIASAGGDTVTLHLGVPEEPATFINGAQKVAHSNVVTLSVIR